MKVNPLIVNSLALALLAFSPNSRADVVTDWNGHFLPLTNRLNG